MQDPNTLAALIVAGGAAWSLTVGARRWADRRALIAACSHDLHLDAADGWNATLRCSKCPHQEPARDFIAELDRARAERVQVAAIHRCPRCGGGL